ncbi:MAG: hypothetical protein MZV70_15750 [Desulfobacterales bacterium]|nr:hypothetical protein [Desulfobacterales bacterium]
MVAEGLVKRFGPVAAVDGVSLTVSAGEVVGLLGPNGAGQDDHAADAGGHPDARRRARARGRPRHPRPAARRQAAPRLPVGRHAALPAPVDARGAALLRPALRAWPTR